MTTCKTCKKKYFVQGAHPGDGSVVYAKDECDAIIVHEEGFLGQEFTKAEKADWRQFWEKNGTKKLCGGYYEVKEMK